jgi:hypothetical protein
MRSRLGSAAAWLAAGVVLGAAAVAGGEGDEDLRERLIELESLSARLRGLDATSRDAPVADEHGLELDSVPVADLVTGVPDYVRARQIAHELAIFGCQAEETLQPYGTIEELVELVRCHVHTDAWETGSQITYLRGSLLLFARPGVNRAARAFLDKELRPGARRTVNLQLEVLEAAEPLAAALAAATGGEIDPALRGRIEEAIGAGKARRAFDGRVLGLARQQVVLWHGAQAATVIDAEVEVAQRAEVSDPFVNVELLGTMVEARSTVGDDPGRIRLRISLDSDELERPVRAAETEQSGALQMPARATMRVDADLWTVNDKWTVAAERTSAEGKRRFLLVRQSVIGGAR